ncbi:hypothetical protein GCM10027343_04660 [Noviherbaspirillum agri]
MDVDPQTWLCLREHVNLFIAMHRDLDIMRGDYRQIRLIKETLEQKDRFLPTHFTQPYRTVNLDQRQAIRIGEGTHSTRQSMAVRICLHHCPDI